MCCYSYDFLEDSVSSNDFELFEELDDALVGVALVLDDLPRLALLGRRDVDDFLAGATPPDGVVGNAEVGHLDLVDRLVLGRHDPLEGGVSGLDHAGGDTD